MDNVGLGTRRYFQDQVKAFFDLCGSADFWELDFEHHDGAIKGLGYAYLRTDSGDYVERDAAAFEAALQNYWRRAELMERLRVQTEGGGNE